MTTSTPDREIAGGEFVVEGEITALAVRNVRDGEAPALAVATQAGRCWWLDPSTEGRVVAEGDCAIDFPTDLDLHPHADRLAVAGARGYATWGPDTEPVVHGTAWSNAVRFSRSGSLAAAAGRHLVVHDAAGEVVYRSDPAPSTVTGVAWTPRRDRIATTSYGGVRIYDGVDPAPAREYEYAGSHLAVAVSPDGRWICSGNQDSSVHIWRTASGEDLEMAGYPEKVTRLAFDETGRWFANNGAPELTVWDFLGKGPRGRAPRLLVGHERIVDLDWRPGTGSVLASVGQEGRVRIWDLTGSAAGKERRPREVLPFDDALGVRWLGRGHLVVSRTGGRVAVLPWPR